MLLTEAELELLDDMLLHVYYTMKDDPNVYNGRMTDAYESLSAKLKSGELAEKPPTPTPDCTTGCKCSRHLNDEDPAQPAPNDDITPNNPWNPNPCHGIWMRKRTHKVIDDSWGIRHEGERYWSAPDGFNTETGVVTLIPYSDTIEDGKRRFSRIGLKPEYVRERFEFMGFGQG